MCHSLQVRTRYLLQEAVNLGGLENSQVQGLLQLVGRDSNLLEHCSLFLQVTASDLVEVSNIAEGDCNLPILTPEEDGGLSNVQ
jgi:hypothetical protein